MFGKTTPETRNQTSDVLTNLKPNLRLSSRYVSDGPEYVIGEHEQYIYRRKTPVYFSVSTGPLPKPHRIAKLQSITHLFHANSSTILLVQMFASPAPVVKRSLARGSATAQNALNSISLMRTTSHVSIEYFDAGEFDSHLTILCLLQAPSSCSVSMSRSASRTGGSRQYYATSTTPGTGSCQMQRNTSSTLGEVGSAIHPSPSLSSYGVYASPSRGYPFPMVTSSSNACSLPMSRGASGSTSQYGLMEGAFENLNIAHGTARYANQPSPFGAPIARGRYACAQTPTAPPMLFSVSRHFPVLSEASPYPSPSLETTFTPPVSIRPQRLRSILKKSKAHSPSPVPRSTSIDFGSTPVLSAPSIPKRTTFSTETTEIGLASSVVVESGLGYRSCRGRPPTPLPEMFESEGELSN